LYNTIRNLKETGKNQSRRDDPRRLSFFLATKEEENKPKILSVWLIWKKEICPRSGYRTNLWSKLRYIKKELKEWLDVIEYYYNTKPIIFTECCFLFKISW
jgi:hypothetical protein